jgi:hypothetical protein
MELSSFSENIVTETIERNGETVELQINIDAIVPDYFDVLEERLAPLNERLRTLQAKAETYQKEQKAKKGKKPARPAVTLLSLEKEMAEIQREAYAERLTCPVKLPDGSYTQILKGWDITENGMAVEPTKDNLMRLPPKAVEQLWECCIARTETVKKRAETSTVTSENAQGGSAGLRVVGQST